MYSPASQNIEMTNFGYNNYPPQNNYFSAGAYSGNPNRSINSPLLKQPPLQEVHRDGPTGINGPVERRECTDIFWGVLFVICFLGFFGIVGFGINLGQPSKLLGFYNQQGVMCSTTASPYAYLVYDEGSIYSATALCVTSCPLVADSFSYLGGGSMIAPYSSFLVADTFCAPQTTSSVTQSIPNFYLYQVFFDLKSTIYLIIVSLGASVILSLFLVFFFRCCPTFIVWVCCLLLFFSMIAVATYAYLYSRGIVYFTIPISLDGISVQGLQITAYVLWGLAGVFLLFLLCTYKRVKLSIGVIETTSLYISQTCHVTLFPPFASILWLGVLTTLLAGLLYLYSIGDVSAINGSMFATVTKTDYGYDLVATIFFYILIGLGVWVLFFVTGFSSFMLSSTAAIWYFSNSSIEMKPHRPLCSSLWRAFRYHIGSIAFGSLILGLCFPLRLLGAIFQRNYAQPSNCFIGCFYKMCDCCVACFSCLLQFMNKGSYTQMAVKGTNYCVSTMEAFRLTATSPIRIAINSALTHIIMFVCKLTLCGIVGVGVFYSILSFKYFSMVSSPMVPTLLCVVIVFGVSTIILSIFGTSANVIVQCFIMDELDAKSRGQKARYCPAPLREVIDNNTYAD